MMLAVRAKMIEAINAWITKVNLVWKWPLVFLKSAIRQLPRSPGSTRSPLRYAKKGCCVKWLAAGNNRSALNQRPWRGFPMSPPLASLFWSGMEGKHCLGVERSQKLNRLSASERACTLSMAKNLVFQSNLNSFSIDSKRLMLFSLPCSIC